MIELHPAIVHFPIALLTIAALFAVISLFQKKEFFREVAFWDLLAGVIGAIAAVLTGLIEERSLVHNEEIHVILEKHEFNGFAILILSFALLTWVWVRKNKFRKGEYVAWVLFLMLCTVAVFYQGSLGGKMVYEQGAGVKPMEVHMEQEGDSTKPHSHSNSVHNHGNTRDTSSLKKATAEKNQHDHPYSKDDLTNKPDTSKQMKERKKELKDMKY